MRRSPEDRALGEGEVRLYAVDFAFVWRFLAGDGQLDVFRAKLTKTFGQPRIVVRRGSRRRRAVGLGLAFAGLGAFPVGLSADLYELALVAPAGGRLGLYFLHVLVTKGATHRAVTGTLPRAAQAAFSRDEPVISHQGVPVRARPRTSREGASFLQASSRA